MNGGGEELRKNLCQLDRERRTPAERWGFLLFWGGSYRIRILMYRDVSCVYPEGDVQLGFPDADCDDVPGSGSALGSARPGPTACETGPSSHDVVTQVTVLCT